MPKSNSQQKSTLDAFTTSKWGRNGEERGALLRVRTGPECPEGNRRELLWDSSLNCGIAKERENVNRSKHTASHSQNKGSEQVQRRASLLRTGPALPAGGRGKGKGANSAPRTASPHHTANRPPVSNQRLPEILDDRRSLGGSRLNIRCTHPTGTGGNWGWGRGGEKAPHTWGERGHQAPGCLICSGRGRHINAGATESALLWRTRKLEPHATQGVLHIEQPGAWAA